jgi:anti-sigma factor RsiW
MIDAQSAPSPAAVPTYAHVQHQFASYLAQELAPAEHAAVGSHLSHCPACATALVTLLHELHATSGLLGSLPRHAAPRALRERLLAIPDREALGRGLESAEHGECLPSELLSAMGGRLLPSGR